MSFSIGEAEPPHVLFDCISEECAVPGLYATFCFLWSRDWTFYENIGFNTVLTDPLMSHLATQLGYSAGEFQALQPIALATFGIVD